MSKALNKMRSSSRERLTRRKKILTNIFPKGFDREELQEKIIFVKVGTDEHPATRQDIEDIRDLINTTLMALGVKEAHIIVTSHTIDVDILSKEELLQFLADIEEKKNSATD